MRRPDIYSFEKHEPGPYEKQMGLEIASVIKVLQPSSPDREATEIVLELAESVENWTAAHAVFNFIRERLLKIPSEQIEVYEYQYMFLESCCQALYNATDPVESFDPSSAYYVWPHALVFANQVDVPEVNIVKIALSRQ